MPKTPFMIALIVVMVSSLSETSGRASVAHRGASAYAPEHTLASYRLALQQGADYVEQDLQITRDGALVCLHDRTLERTTNVEEVFPHRFRNSPRGRIWPVSDFTLAEIKRLDAGSWFGSQFNEARVPTFGEAIQAIRGKAGLYPELKDPGYYQRLGFEMGRLVLDELEKHGLAQPDADPHTPVILQSFHPATLKKLRFEQGSRLPAVLLVGTAQTEWLSEAGLTRAARFSSGIGPAKGLLLDDPDIVLRAHQKGLTVTPYTFRADRLTEGFEDATAEMRHFLDELGVDALFTNNPDLFPRR